MDCDKCSREEAYKAHLTKILMRLKGLRNSKINLPRESQGVCCISSFQSIILSCFLKNYDILNCLCRIDDDGKSDVKL